MKHRESLDLGARLFHVEQYAVVSPERALCRDPFSARASARRRCSSSVDPHRVRASPATRSEPEPKPSSARPAVGQRPAAADSVPPAARSPPGARPVAGTRPRTRPSPAGAPNDRATTRSNAAPERRRPGPAPRPVRTPPRPDPRGRDARPPARRNVAPALLRVEQHRARRPGNATASTSPGRPPPAPRSRNAPCERTDRPGQVDGVVELATRPGPGPRNPSPRASSRIPTARGSGPTAATGPVTGERGRRSGGRSTTRRRGSSPSDSVATPSISDAVSCTTLRSIADIGSSAWAARSRAPSRRGRG